MKKGYCKGRNNNFDLLRPHKAQTKMIVKLKTPKGRIPFIIKIDRAKTTKPAKKFNFKYG